MAFRLKRDYAVAADPNRENFTPNMMVTLVAGTDIGDISSYELGQLSPEHFVGVDEDDGGLPDDWRDDAARERDEVQRANMAERMARHEAARAAVREARGET